MSQKDMARLDAGRNSGECFQALLSDVEENKGSKRYLMKRQENDRNRFIHKVRDGLTPRIPPDPGGSPCERVNKRDASIDRWHDCFQRSGRFKVRIVLSDCWFGLSSSMGSTPQKPMGRMLMREVNNVRADFDC